MRSWRAFASGARASRARGAESESTVSDLIGTFLMTDDAVDDDDAHTGCSTRASDECGGGRV